MEELCGACDEYVALNEDWNWVVLECGCSVHKTCQRDSIEKLLMSKNFQNQCIICSKVITERERRFLAPELEELRERMSLQKAFDPCMTSDCPGVYTKQVVDNELFCPTCG